jgi:hypothetical protein
MFAIMYIYDTAMGHYTWYLIPNYELSLSCYQQGWYYPHEVLPASNLLTMTFR